MEDKDKKRDPMPPPDATPEEIGEFWDTHSLADYWDQTHEVEFQVNLKSRQNLSPHESEAADQSNTLSREQGWQKLKYLIQSMGNDGNDFEKLVAELLGLLLETHFEIEKSGYQPRGDAINEDGTIVVQAKKYNDNRSLNRKEIVGDIREAYSDPELPNLQTYVLAASRTMSPLLLSRLGKVESEISLDIITIELTNDLSDLGALCVTFWEDIREFFAPLDTNQPFLDWVGIEKNKLETTKKILELRDKLKYGIQTQKHVEKDIEKYLLDRFSRNEGFNPINLPQAIDRGSLEAKITDWWETGRLPICYLEGKEGHGKTWLASKWMSLIREKENIATFWLDSKDWNSRESIIDLLQSIHPMSNRKSPNSKIKQQKFGVKPSLSLMESMSGMQLRQHSEFLVNTLGTRANGKIESIFYLPRALWMTTLILRIICGVGAIKFVLTLLMTLNYRRH